MLVKLAGRDTETVVKALIKHARKLPHKLDKSLTWDRGKELAAHKRFTVPADIEVYFCDPKSPWQRGSNEKTNGLLRQYLPKGIDISGYSQAKLNAMARQLNERSRKTLGYLIGMPQPINMTCQDAYPSSRVPGVGKESVASLMGRSR